MREAIEEASRLCRTGAYFILVIGNNQICGVNFLSKNYLEHMLVEAGFNLKLCLVDDIHSRGLMTKRNKAASIIVSEWILLLRKK